MLAFACFGFVHLDTAAGAFIINGRIRDNNIAGNRVVIAKIFVDVGSSNLACCNSADNGSRTGYAVAAGENAFVISQLAAGKSRDGVKQKA